MSEYLDTAFRRLLGRVPSAEERERLYRVKDVLGLSDNDSMWLLFIVLGHYEVLFGNIPFQAEQAAQAAREAADAEIKRVEAHADRIRATALKRLAPQLLQTVERNLSQRERLNTARMAIASVAALLGYTAAVVGASALLLGDKGTLEMASGTGLQLLASQAYHVPAGAMVITAGVGVLAAWPLLRAGQRWMGLLRKKGGRKGW